jgi:hypothetical protein
MEWVHCPQTLPIPAIKIARVNAKDLKNEDELPFGELSVLWVRTSTPFDRLRHCSVRKGDETPVEL